MSAPRVPVNLCDPVSGEASLSDIDTVVFDLGEVLIPWHPRTLFRKLIPDAKTLERFLAEVCTSEWNALQDAGRPLAEGTAERIAAFPQYEAWIHAFYDRWPEMLGEVIEGSVELLRDLKANGYRVLALSNWSGETFPLARRLYPILSEFEGIVISGPEGMIKPDPAIYRLLCERYGVVPEQAVFIDDNLRNVEGAQAIGMHAIQFHTPLQVREALACLGLPLCRQSG
jgi:2-haloacid dehalogenase